MIFGIGTDIIHIPRIEAIYKKFGARFLHRILHEDEYNIFCKLKDFQQMNFLAKRFAVKEAVAKAFGLGIGSLSFKSINIHNDRNGKPQVKITALTKNINNKHKIEVSISDDYPIAVAFAVVFL